MTNSKKVILMVMVVFLLSAITTIAFATNDNIQIINGTNMDGVLNITETNSSTTNTATNIAANTTDTTNAVNLIQNTNTSTYNNTTSLPQTGAGDYTMILIIGLFAVSAVYAYKKIVDYKNV